MKDAQQALRGPWIKSQKGVNMKRIIWFALPTLALLLANCATPSAQTSARAPPTWLQDIQNKSPLVAEVHGLKAVDQFERNKIVALLNNQTMPAAERDARVWAT
jgi:hypothetical protein